MDIDLKPFQLINERIEEIARSTIAIMPNLIAALVALTVFLLLRSAVVYGLKRLFQSWNMRRALREALLSLVSVLMIVVAIMVTATVAVPGLSPADLLTSLGIGSLAIGLAFRDTFENFLAGLLILMRKPMRIGDYIECDEVAGKVDEITLRDTYVRRTDGVLVLVPNSYIFKNPTRVLTDLPLIRNDIVVGVAYGEDVDAARRVIEGAFEGLATVSEDRAIEVFATEFNSSSIDFEVTWWCGSSPLEIRQSRDKVVAAIKRALDEAGIEIPFPYRTLTFKDRDLVEQAMGALSDREAA